MVMRKVPPGTIEKRRHNLEMFNEQQLFKQYMEYQLTPGMEAYNSANSGRTGEFSRQLVPKEEQENIERRRIKKQDISDEQSSLPDFTGPRPQGYWGRDRSWQQLDPYQKAAAMALLEADSKGSKISFADARNALGAMVNRADKEGADLGDHVSGKIYQPTIEPSQYARLQSVTRMPEFQALTELARGREAGEIPDWVGGATHFLAKPDVMLRLEADDPQKYRSWRKWTGYDDATGKYANEVMSDSSHVFLAPEGRHSAGQSLVGDPPPPSEPGEGGYDTPSPLPTASASPGLPKLAELFGLPSGGKNKPAAAQANPLEDLKSPIGVGALAPQEGQDPASFALLPAQRMRMAPPGQPTLPVPRKPPEFSMG